METRNYLRDRHTHTLTESLLMWSTPPSLMGTNTVSVKLVHFQNCWKKKTQNPLFHIEMKLLFIRRTKKVFLLSVDSCNTFLDDGSELRWFVFSECCCFLTRSIDEPHVMVFSSQSCVDWIVDVFLIFLFHCQLPYIFAWRSWVRALGEPYA